MPKKTIIYSFSAIFLLVVLFLGFKFFKLSGEKESFVPFFVKVRIIKQTDKFNISSNGLVDVFDSTRTKILASGIDLSSGTLVSLKEGKITLAGNLFDGDNIQIISSGETIRVEKNNYHGQIIVLKNKTGLMVINRVEIEGYLKGVLPKEVYVFWPFTMLKAQAIASRSFAIFEALRNSNNEYDLTSDTYSQVYAGQSSENYRTNRAVDKTRGLILEYDGNVLPAFFQSCCGGKTRNAKNVWGVDLAPLKGVKCPWCRWSPYYRWKNKERTEDIVSRFQESGYSFDKIDDIRQGKIDKNGFLLFVRVKSRGKWYDIKVQDFRAVLGRSNIKSAKFKIKKYPRFYLFYGYGWGHGVGMCQWGAFGASLRRWSAEKILIHYYPGAQIMPIEEVLDLETLKTSLGI